MTSNTYPDLLLQYLNVQYQQGVINIKVADCFVLPHRHHKEFLSAVGVVNFLYQYQMPINLN
jgi:hypothetical protein